jgi:MFS family permease
MSSTKLWTRDFILLFCANFLMAIAFYLLIPTLPFYLVNFMHLNKAMTGLVLSSYVVASILTRPFSGYLVDRFSRKKLYLYSYIIFALLFFGYVLAGAMLAFFILIRVIHGIIWGTMTTASNTLVIDITPASRRGEAIGIFGLSSNISMSIGPMMGLILYDKLPFNYIFYSALITGIAGFLLAFPLKVRYRPPVVHQPVSLDRFVLVKGIPSGINLILVTVSYGMIFSFAAMFGKENKIPNAGAFFIIMALGIMLSRFFGGKIVDKGKIKEVAIASMITLTLGMLILSASHQSLPYFISALVIGFGFGLAFPAMQTLMVNLSEHHQRGTAISTYFTAFDVGVGTGMYLGGKIAEMTGFTWSFIIGAFLNLIAVFYFIFISAPHYSKHHTCQIAEPVD